jgi:cysteine desulfurase/selenocysteine lyase
MDDYIEKVRNDFPMLKQKTVYLDSAATSLKPQIVIDAVNEYNSTLTTNVHRSIHKLGEDVTKLYEQTRDQASKFLNTRFREEIIFTKGTTEGINLLANTLDFQKGDEVLISELEHHSNIVPWQLKGLITTPIKIDAQGDIDLQDFKSKFSKKTKLVSITGMSNVLGTITPLKEMIKIAHSHSCKVLCDAAQLIVHRKVDVQDLDVDFLVFSAHKLYGPTGVGILYGKKELLTELPPFLGGGDMIDKVSFERTTYNDLPYKLEAGTPNIEGVLGLGKVFDYLESLDLQVLHDHESQLFDYAKEELLKIPGLKILGNPIEKGSVISFIIDDVNLHDLATIIGMDNIAIRTGHHCAQPLHTVLDIPSSARLSLAFYNNKSDIDALINSLTKALNILR